MLVLLLLKMMMTVVIMMMLDNRFITIYSYLTVQTSFLEVLLFKLIAKLNLVVLYAVSWTNIQCVKSSNRTMIRTMIMLMMMMMIDSHLMHILAVCTVRDDYHIKAELLQKELNELQQKVCYIHLCCVEVMSKEAFCAHAVTLIYVAIIPWHFGFVKT